MPLLRMVRITLRYRLLVVDLPLGCGLFGIYNEEL